MGEVLKYRITVTSEANVTQNNIVISDRLNHASGQVVFTDYPEGSLNSDNTVTIADLGPKNGPEDGPGDTVELLCEYRIVKADAGQTITNAAVAKQEGSQEEKGTDPTDPATVEETYTLTIHYVYATGGTVAPDYVGQYLAGEAYSVFSPTLSGYRWNWTFVAGNMPARDLEVTVSYWTEGGGGDPDPTPGPAETPTPSPTVTPTPSATPTPPVIPVPPTEPIIIPVEPTLVDVENEEVPLQGIRVDVDDDGNVTLTPIAEDEIPLDNRELDDHECCILSFLLMLLTLIIYTWFTHSMKKNQKRLEEMKDQLAEENLKRQLGITDKNSNTGKSARA